MTLERRLASVISALVLAALIGVQFIHVRDAHRHQQNQLESLAQDAATAIGLSLGVLMRDADRVVAQTAINAAFDRGHYERIELVGANGELLAGRMLGAVRGGRYPAWFAELFRLDAPTAESLVTTGWRQIGKLRVTVHPRFAYEQLWATARDTILYLLAIYAVALVLVHLLMRGVLRPLRAIERAAQAIASRDYVQIAERPGTRELARVVEAMNAMSGKVAEAISGEAARADALQRAAQVDEVSGLLNRGGFTGRFDTAYAQDRERFDGVFALLQIDDLAAIDRQLGRARCDELLRAAGRLLSAAASAAQGLAGRWGGPLFVLALPTSLEAGAALERTRAGLEQLIAEYGLEGQAVVPVGAVRCSGEDLGAEALAGAALDALNRARLSPGSRIELRAPGNGAGIAPATAAAVREALAGRNLRLYGQVAYSLPGRRPLHVEIMARIAGPGGTILPALEIIPVISQQGLAWQMDEIVVESVLRELAAAAEPRPVAVNLSVRSLAHGDFIDWLSATLARAPQMAARLVFELSEHGVAQNEAAAARLADALRKAGSAMAIDHFGMHRNSLAIVQRLRPAYLKLAALHTPALRADPGTRFFVDSLVRAARQLDVPLIAQAVEDAGVLADLEALGFAGYQGYAAGAPAAWPAPRAS
jgi:EAL domain-containing protein (putative c-di-GMP-specific phosphodiesterase class I)/GGDEF domain-containing protein